MEREETNNRNKRSVSNDVYVILIKMIRICSSG